MTPLEVLAAHQPRIVYTGPDEGYAACTGCDWTGPVAADHPAHVLDALTKAGHAVVTLPEVKVADWGDSYWPVPEAESAGREGKVKIEDDGRIHASMVSNPLPTSNAARAYAAALLAAAAAETGGKA